MARFVVDEKNLPEIGRALARAVSDPQAKQALMNDPRGYLISAGIDAEVLDNMDLAVHSDTDSKLNFVVPNQVDERKVASNDEEYLTELAHSVILACHL